MHISQKLKDVLHITDVQICNLTFLSPNLREFFLNAPKVSKAASINNVSNSKNLQK